MRNWVKRLKQRDAAADPKTASRRTAGGTGADLLTRWEAAKYLGVAEQTLAIWKPSQRYSLPVAFSGPN